MVFQCRRFQRSALVASFTVKSGPSLSPTWGSESYRPCRITTCTWLVGLTFGRWGSHLDVTLILPLCNHQRSFPFKNTLCSLGLVDAVRRACSRPIAAPGSLSVTAAGWRDASQCFRALVGYLLQPGRLYRLYPGDVHFSQDPCPSPFSPPILLHPMAL